MSGGTNPGRGGGGRSAKSAGSALANLANDPTADSGTVEARGDDGGDVAGNQRTDSSGGGADGGTRTRDNTAAGRSRSKPTGGTKRSRGRPRKERTVGEKARRAEPGDKTLVDGFVPPETKKPATKKESVDRTKKLLLDNVGLPFDTAVVGLTAIGYPQTGQLWALENAERAALADAVEQCLGTASGAVVDALERMSGGLNIVNLVMVMGMIMSPRIRQTMTMMQTEGIINGARTVQRQPDVTERGQSDAGRGTAAVGVPENGGDPSSAEPSAEQFATRTYAFYPQASGV